MRQSNIFKRFASFISRPFRMMKVISTITTTMPGQPTYPETNYENLVRQGYRRNELIYSAVSRTADSAALINIRLRSKSSKEEIEQHPVLDLIGSPNEQMDEFDLWSSVVIFQKFGGRAIYEKQRNVGGEVIKLWPLQPGWISTRGDAKAPIQFYEYKVPGQPKKIIPAEDILDIKIFDPLNEFHSWPPVAVCARVGDVDNSITDYTKLVMENGGVPQGYLKTTKRVDPEKAEEIRARWTAQYGGFKGWAAPAVMGEDVDYMKTGFTFAELGTDILDDRNETRICGALKIPPILAGANVGLKRSTYANYKEARLSWWEEVLRPMYKDFLDKVNKQILAEWGNPDLELYFDFSQVPAFQEDETSKWTRANEAIAKGWITVNEAREIVRLEEIPITGDVFLRSFGSQEVPINTLRTTEVLSQKREFKAEPFPFEENREELEKEMSSDLVDHFVGMKKRIKDGLEETYGMNNG